MVLQRLIAQLIKEITVDLISNSSFFALALRLCVAEGQLDRLAFCVLVPASFSLLVELGQEGWAHIANRLEIFGTQRSFELVVVGREVHRTLSGSPVCGNLLALLLERLE